METVRSVMCVKCRQQVDLSNVRYDDNGEDMICHPCYKHKKNKKQAILPDKEKLICLKCNYRFSRSDKSKTTKRCPYCGSENIDKYRLTANDLIDQVTNINR